jgi:hypothetical protein
MYGVCVTIAKRLIDDAELILKNYPKILTIFEDLVNSGNIQVY